MAVAEQGFFVTGGTLAPNAPSYIERQADQDLFENLLAGEFCYVLNSRQMGKSSLSVRTMNRLQAAGVRTVFIDLTKLGGKNVTAEQWYAGLLAEIGRGLDLRQPLVKYFVEHKEVGPMQRLFGALREVALEAIKEPICIFIDEIDATRALSFSTDEFFAGIRECYNRRVLDPEYRRLAFCLLGVAAPQDLIQDVRTTPFNIGKNIALRDFRSSEVAPLARALGRGGEKDIQRVLDWTGGQPFLTQTLCASLAAGERNVDRLVHDTFLEKRARLNHVNLADVANRVLNGYSNAEEIDTYRADILQMYRRILSGKKVPDDEQSRLATVLKLSGIVRVEEGLLKPRNRIYASVFDQAWIDENMPGQELRRQQRAYRLGILRAAAIGGVVVAALAVLSGYSVFMANRATKSEANAKYELYVADVNLMRTAWEQNNPERLQDLLKLTRGSNARGWEWHYWNRLANLGEWHVKPNQPGDGAALSPDGKEVAMRYHDSLKIYDAADGRELRSFPMERPALGFAIWSPDGKTILDSATDEGLYLFDAKDGKLVQRFDAPRHETTARPFSSDGRFLISSASGFDDQEFLSIWDVRTGKIHKRVRLGDFSLHSGVFLKDDREIVAETWSLDASKGSVFVIDLETGKAKRHFQTARIPYVAMPSPDGRYVAVGLFDGYLEVWEVATGERRFSQQEHAGTIMYASWSEDSSKLVTVGSDRLAKVWSVEAGVPKQVQRVRGPSVAMFDPNGDKLLAGYFDISMFDLSKLKESLAIKLPVGQVGPLRIDPSGTRWFADSSVLQTLDPDSFEVSEMPEQFGLISDDARYRLHGEDGKWSLWRTLDSVEVATLPAMSVPPSSLHVSENGARAAMVLEDRSVAVIEIPSGKLVRHYKDEGRLTAADLSPSGDHVATGDLFGAVTLWSTATGEAVRSFKGHAHTVNSIRFSEAGDQLLTGAEDDLAIVWNTASGSPKVILRGHSQSVLDAQFSPDMRRIITASMDLTARLWDAKTGRELLALNGGDGEILSAQFTPDGSRIVTSGASGIVRVWLGDSSDRQNLPDRVTR